MIFNYTRESENPHPAKRLAACSREGTVNKHIVGQHHLRPPEQCKQNVWRTITSKQMPQQRKLQQLLYAIIYSLRHRSQPRH